MTQPDVLRILFVEDLPSDAELAARVLRRGGLALESRRVETRETLLAALQEFQPDLVISDYAMPGFDGMQALQLCRQHDPLLPFIVLTGSMNEDTAVACIKAGADDYVIKEHITRLPFAVREALERRNALRARQAAEEALRESEQRFRRLAENAQDLIYRYEFTPRRGFTYVSPAATAITGFTPEEHYADPDLGFKLVHPDDRPLLEAASRGDTPPGQPLALRWVRKDGTVIWTEQRNVPILDQDGNLIAIEGIARDITERKQSEDALRRAAQRLECLVTLGRAVAATLNLQTIYRAAHEHLATLVDCPNLAISLFDADSQTIRAAYVRSNGSELDVSLLPPLRFDPQHADSGRSLAIASQKPVIVDDLAARSRGGQTVNIGDERLPDSAIYTPMVMEGRVIGLLELQSYRSKAYSPEDGDWLSMAANQIGLSIQNARLFERLQQRVANLEALNRISVALRAVSQQDEFLNIVLDETLRALNAEHGSIHLWDAATGELRQATARGWLSELAKASARLGEGALGNVFASGQAHTTRDLRHDPRVGAQPNDGFPDGWGGVCVPIRSADQRLGVLLVAVPGEREFSDDEVRLLDTLAEMTGAALHRMRLHDETVRNLNEMQALHSIDRAIAASMDLRMTLTILLEHITAQLKADAARVLLMDPRAYTMDYAAGRGFGTPVARDAHVRLGQGFAGRAALDRQPVQVTDPVVAAEDAQLRDLWVAERFAFYYATPLVAKGELKGVLEIFQRKPFNPGPESIAFMEMVRSQAAIAIDNGQLFEDLQRLNLELTMAYDATVEGWSRALDYRDKETEGHTLRVTELTLHLARAMDLPESELVHIRRGALLHDIGKMGVPDAVLLKPGPLTDEEWTIMRRHPQLARDLLAPIAYLKPALDIPYCHHEKWDGTGYPRGLKDDEIPLAARLFAIVDVWDALRSDRPYRAAWPEEKVLEHIRSLAGTHFDPQVVPVFLKVLEQVHVRQ